MSKIRTIFNVDSLPLTSNVCMQDLREIGAFPSVNPRISVAHVSMSPGNISLNHKHESFSEVYVVLNGMGILTTGGKRYCMTSGSYIVIPPGTPHFFQNPETSNSVLEHLVISSPPFCSNDVIVLGMDVSSIDDVGPHYLDFPPVTARDRATVYPMISGFVRENLGFSIAFGFLTPGKKSVSHYHKNLFEAYYVLNGSGNVFLKNVGDNINANFPIAGGTIVLIPPYSVHSLSAENSDTALEVLCISTPAYSDDDFFEC
ncbi:cupin domain-containing protein [Candidatus Woesearchaeota archaeon]|nr:cupin domain-containing protein [Candidatus Woesearchaeota archaeon]